MTRYCQPQVQDYGLPRYNPLHQFVRTDEHRCGWKFVGDLGNIRSAHTRSYADPRGLEVRKDVMRITLFNPVWAILAAGAVSNAPGEHTARPSRGGGDPKAFCHAPQPRVGRSRGKHQPAGG